MNIAKIILFILVAGIIISCRDYSPRLKYALLLSGDNKEQLEIVLDHYVSERQNCLKYQAAKFLIENMPGHFSISKASRDSLYKLLDRVSPNLDNITKRTLSGILINIPCINKQLVFNNDLQTISSGYLIKHIDFMFEMKNKLPWLKDIPTTDFFEYLLPYSLHDIRLDSLDYVTIKQNCDMWQKFGKKYNYDCFNIRDQVRNSRYLLARTSYEIKEICDFKKIGIPEFEFDCFFTANYNHTRLRFLLIPSAIDYTPHWVDYSGRHFWVTVIDPADTKCYENFIGGRLMGKVYRFTYSENAEIIKEINGDNYIPPFISSKFIKDVTEQYISPSDARINLTNWTRDQGYVYAAVYNGKDLYPCSWEKVVDSDKVIFHKLGKEIVYFPIYYNGNKKNIAGYPFKIKRNEEVEYFVPDTNSLQSIKLSRNSYYDIFSITYKISLIGTQIQLSNDPDFTNYELFKEINEVPNTDSLVINITTPNKYRYVRIIKPTSFNLNKVTLNNAQADSIPFTVLEAKHNKYLEQLPRGGFYNLKKITLDCKEGYNNLSINIINPIKTLKEGQEYELLYFDLSGWKSLGKKYVKDHVAEFDSVPEGAIFWLKDTVKDSMDRIFTIKNKEIRFY